MKPIRVEPITQEELARIPSGPELTREEKVRFGGRDDQLGLLPVATPTEPGAAWSKERGGGGFLYRTETRFGRIWPVGDGRWSANRRPEPYIHKDPKWEGPMTFKDRRDAETWVEQGGST